MKEETKPINILVIEDEIMYSKMIQFQLQKLENSDFKMNLYSAASITESADFIDLLEPDIILLDLWLPETSGFETFRTTKENFPNCAIIVMSGTASESMTKLLVEHGAQDFLMKSDIDTEVLKRTLSKSLRRLEYIRSKAEVEVQFDEFFENSLTPICVYNLKNQKVVYGNRALKDLMKLSDYEELIKYLSQLMIELYDKQKIKIEQKSVNVDIKTPNQQVLNVRIYSSYLKYNEDVVVCYFFPENSSKNINNILTKGDVIYLQNKLEQLEEYLNTGIDYSENESSQNLEVLKKMQQLINKINPN